MKVVKARLSNRRFVHVGAACVALLAGSALAAVLLAPEGDGVPDRRLVKRPARTLALGEARLAQGPGGLRIVVRGESTLVDGARVMIALRPAEGRAGRADLASFEAEVRDGRFECEQAATGEVVAGSYEAHARFDLAWQTQPVREALAYQPSALEARRALLLPPQVVQAADATAEVRALFEAVNQLDKPEPARVAALERQLAGLEARLWLSEHKAALLELRRALVVVRRPGHQRREFERHLLQAHVLAGL